MYKIYTLYIYVYINTSNQRRKEMDNQTKNGKKPWIDISKRHIQKINEHNKVFNNRH